jgi:hypothetical protein
MAITNRSLRTARTKGETVCAQHHVPRSQCPPSSGHPRSVRFRDDDWAAAEDAARARNTDTGPLIISAAQAVLGYVRCYRCPVDDPPVPLRCGDLTGRPLAGWIAEAEKRAVGQHPDHEPVWLGAEPAFVDDRDIDATLEHLRSQVRQVRVGGPLPIPPPPASAVFREPDGARM